ncbi:hypothetical protein BJX99DRAFT_255423 [Aspergillus californicus]
MTLFYLTGFRRIGVSECLAFSFDNEHESRGEVPASEKFNLTDETRVTMIEGLGNEASNYPRSHPLHHAACVLDDTKCIRVFEENATGKYDWGRCDSLERSLLHLTAYYVKPKSTAWLLSNIPQAETWRIMRDYKGNTPIETLQDRLEDIRTEPPKSSKEQVHPADKFDGYPVDAVNCLGVLSSPSGDRADRSEVEIFRLKYGCTCGECEWGYLSVRMKLTLILQSQMISSRLRRYIREDNSDEAVRSGFCAVFERAAEMLKSRWRLSVRGMLDDLKGNWNQEDMAKYLECAGEHYGIEAALLHLFDISRQEDPKTGGFGAFRTFEKKWSRLNACRNDHEYGFVARRCGLEAKDMWDPYIPYYG